VIGGLVSLRESMKLLAAQADQGDTDKSWPELAQFDCYACHHDLKSKSWRQKRGYKGNPGRPDMRPWSTALAHLGILQASKGDADQEKKLAKDLHDKLKELTTAFTAQPFGEPKAVAQAARQTEEWANGLLTKIRSEGVDRAAAHRLLVGLGAESKSRLLDFDSARQLTWAFRSIQNELDPEYKTKAEPAKLLKELDEQLKLDLPEGKVEIAKDYLKDVLEKLNSFEAEQFQPRFEQLLRTIDKQKK